MRESHEWRSDSRGGWSWTVQQTQCGAVVQQTPAQQTQCGAVVQQTQAQQARCGAVVQQTQAQQARCGVVVQQTECNRRNAAQSRVHKRPPCAPPAPRTAGTGPSSAPASAPTAPPCPPRPAPPRPAPSSRRRRSCRLVRRAGRRFAMGRAAPRRRARARSRAGPLPCLQARGPCAQHGHDSDPGLGSSQATE
jgi:hypothetical protein